MTHHVLRLQVAMHDAAHVRRRDAVENRLEPLGRDGGRHRLLPVHRGPQRLSLHALHHDVGTFAFQRADVMHGDDVRMIETRGRARLAPEASQRTGLAKRAAQHDLHRDLAVEFQIARFVHRAHAALADEPVQSVTRVDRARHRQRQRQELLVDRTLLDIAAEARAAQRAFLEQVGHRAVESREHVVTHAHFFRQPRAQAQVLADHRGLFRDCAQEARVAVAVGLLGFFLAQQQRADQAVVAVRDRHDQVDAALLQPIHIFGRKTRLGW